jgi:alpha-galactosidase
MNLSIDSCYASLNNDLLIIGNSFIERRYLVKNGLLHASSFKCLLTKMEWLSKTSTAPSSYPSIENLPEEDRKISLSSTVKRPTPVSQEAKEITLTAKGNSLTLLFKFIVFPNVAAITMQLFIQGNSDLIKEKSNVETKTAIPMGDEKTLTHQNLSLPPIDAMEIFNLAPQHLKLTQVVLHDTTDMYNELAQENQWLLHPNEAQIPLIGNLFFLEDSISNCGLIFLKEAPLPHARPIKNTLDFRVHGKANFSSAIKVAEFDKNHARYPLGFQIGLYGHGMGDEIQVGYRWAIITYHGGRAERIKALQDYQNQWRPYLANRDGLILSNTWGDRSMNSRVNEDFILNEVNACAKLGIDIMQIDDGWQRGLDNAPASGSTDLWQGIWKASTNYWLPHPKRLPNGLEPIVTECQKKEVQMGIWYVADPFESYSNWRLDLARLLELHNKHGVNNFKFDGVVLSSKLSEKNFYQLVTELQIQSQNKIVIDLDVTAGIRQGYFGLLENGPLFVENRYSDWHGYWPHQTLRNLWTLSQYIHPVRLRFEFLNHTRNLPFYQADPLAPAEYESDYLFATIMFASSLAWFETQHYPKESFKKVASLIKIWKKHRENVFQSTIIPIGAQPTGTTWTGFCAVSADKKSSYVLIFRELNNEATHQFEIPLLDKNAIHVKKLAGKGNAKIRNETLQVRIPNSLQYLFLEITE